MMQTDQIGYTFTFESGKPGTAAVPASIQIAARTAAGCAPCRLRRRIEAARRGRYICIRSLNSSWRGLPQKELPVDEIES
jgi:hypothetical protein